MFHTNNGLKFFNKKFKKFFKLADSTQIIEFIECEAINCSVHEMAESSGETLLHLAAKYGQFEVAQYLILKGCDVDARTGETGCTPLIVAASYGYISICQILLDADADLFATNFFGKSAFYAITLKFSCNKSHLDFFSHKLNSLELTDEELVLKLIHINCPMYYIVQLNNAEITVMLRQQGFTIPKSSPKDDLLLHEAVWLKNLENVKLVLEQQDLDVNYLDTVDYAPIHYAVQLDFNGNLSIIKLLLDKGADINIHGPNGVTPLFTVFNSSMANEHKIHCISFLLYHGADPQILDFFGNTVFDYAMSMFVPPFDDETLLIPVLSYLALREAIGLPISDELCQKINDEESLKIHFKLCKCCLEDMKNYRVNRKINLYKILTESDEKILEYMRIHKKLLKFVCNFKCNNYYYKYVMEERCFKALEVIEKETQRNNL